MRHPPASALGFGSASGKRNVGDLERSGTGREVSGDRGGWPWYSSRDLWLGFGLQVRTVGLGRKKQWRKEASGPGLGHLALPSMKRLCISCALGRAVTNCAGGTWMVPACSLPWMLRGQIHFGSEHRNSLRFYSDFCCQDRAKCKSYHTPPTAAPAPHTLYIPL